MNRQLAALALSLCALTSYAVIPESRCPFHSAQLVPHKPQTSNPPSKLFQGYLGANFFIPQYEGAIRIHFAKSAVDGTVSAAHLVDPELTNEQLRSMANQMNRAHNIHGVKIKTEEKHQEGDRLISDADLRRTYRALSSRGASILIKAAHAVVPPDQKELFVEDQKGNDRKAIAGRVDRLLQQTDSAVGQNVKAIVKALDEALSDPEIKAAAAVFREGFLERGKLADAKDEASMERRIDIMMDLGRTKGKIKRRILELGYERYRNSGFATLSYDAFVAAMEDSLE